MGLVFGYVWLRTGRLWPLIVAHALIDAVAFVGYALAAGHLTGCNRVARRHVHSCCGRQPARSPGVSTPRQRRGAVAGDPARSQLPAASHTPAAEPTGTPTSTPAAAAQATAAAGPSTRTTAAGPSTAHHRRTGPPPPAPPKPKRPRRKRRWGRVLLALVLHRRGRAGGRRSVDGLVAAPNPGTGRLPGAARSGHGTTWLLVGSDSRQASDARTAGGTRHRRRSRDRPHRHDPAGPHARPRFEHADHDGVDPAGLLRGDSRLRQRQDQRGVRRSAAPRCWRRPSSRRRVCAWTTTRRSASTDSPVMVDAVGGVTMCPAEPISDPLAGIDLPAGCQELDGRNALGLRAHTCHSARRPGPDGQPAAFMSALIHRAASPPCWLNPLRWYPMAHAASGAVTVDERRPHLGPGPARRGRCTATSPPRPCRSVNSPAAIRARSWCGTDEAADRLFAALESDAPVPQDVIDAGSRDTLSKLLASV